jgi:hypothetical protein
MMWEPSHFYDFYESVAENVRKPPIDKTTVVQMTICALAIIEMSGGGGMPNPVQAELIYDTKAQPLSAGVRAVVQRARRVMFAADDTELLLLIAPDRRPERVWMLGQVIDDGVPLEGASVSIHGSSIHGSAEPVERATDQEGEFRVAELPKGSYGFEIETALRTVTVAPFDVD